MAQTRRPAATPFKNTTMELAMTEYRHIMETPETTVAAEYEPSQDGSIVQLTEQQLEDRFVDRLIAQGYERVEIKSADALRDNLRRQLEALNGFTFEDREWDRFFHGQLANPNSKIADKTALLQRDSAKLSFERDDGVTKNVMLVDKTTIHNNRLQVARQYVAEGGAHKNRYDVTILVNGLPLVQIELKRPGGKLREAFNQIQRYQNDSFWSQDGLFEYVQIFVISTGVETKYYSNTTRERAVAEGSAVKGRKKRASASFEFTSCWADARNKQVHHLDDFARCFFAKNTLLNILTKYCVFTSENVLLVMRPYQIAATERILQKIKTAVSYKLWTGTSGGGFIWHTTGSGKTLTSFKTAQLAAALPEIDKVLFVVDRKDLDYQTIREYDRFEKGAANGSRNTATLQRQLEDRDANGIPRRYPIIVTTIQKLQSYIKKADKSSPVFQKRFVFIFDECHRSQFGDMHSAISKTFKKRLLFGFTGTPIFKENARTINGRLATTELAFGSAANDDRGAGKPRSSALHVYNIIDAINDGNVLKFHVDFVSTIQGKEGAPDYQVEKIDTDDAVMAPERIQKIVEYILKRFDQKTMRGAQEYPFKVVENPVEVARRPDAVAKTQEKRYRGFNSIFAVSSVNALMRYYREFKKQLGERFGKDFKIATIFSYTPNSNAYNPNEDETGRERPETNDGDVEPLGAIDEENSDDTKGLDPVARSFLSDAIDDYNAVFKTSYSVDGESFANYYKDVSQRVKNREVDLLLVVNMFLTGFDAPALNTLWVDKNLQYHGLLQAFSRTNRILNPTKSQGNVVCFRNLRKELDDALALFGNKDASGFVLLRTYEEYMSGYMDENGDERQGYKTLVETFRERFAPGSDPFGETEKREFVKLFSELLRVRNILLSFDEFEGADLFDEAEFQSYTGTYLRLHDELRPGPDGGDKGENINDDLVFETELVAQIDVNVDYILFLVGNYAKKGRGDRKLRDAIERAVDASPTLRSKKELVDRFVERVSPSADVYDEWRRFVEEERESAVAAIIRDENLNEVRTREYLAAVFRNAQLGDDPSVAISGAGTDVDQLLPRRSLVRRGDDGLSRPQLKERVLQKLRKFFAQFSGLVAPEEQ